MEQERRHKLTADFVMKAECNVCIDGGDTVVNTRRWWDGYYYYHYCPHQLAHLELNGKMH